MNKHRLKQLKALLLPLLLLLITSISSINASSPKKAIQTPTPNPSFLNQLTPKNSHGFLLVDFSNYSQLFNIIVTVLFLILIFFLITQKRLSNALNHILHIEKLTLEIGTIFNNNNFEKNINESLQVINHYLDAEVTLYAEYNAEAETFLVKKASSENNLYLIETKQDLHFIANSPLKGHLATEKTFHLNSLSFTTNDLNTFPPKIKSALFLPIKSRKAVHNHIIVLSDKRNLSFTQEKITALDLLSTTISAAVNKNQARRKEIDLATELQEKNQELEMVFNSIDFELLKIHLSSQRIEPILTTRVAIPFPSTVKTFIEANFHPDFISVLLTQIEDIRKNFATSVSLDCQILKNPHDSKDAYWVNVKIFSEMNEIFTFNDIAYIIIHNIHQRKISEFIINDRNQKLNHIIENSANLIVEIDKNSNFVFMNEQAKKVLGIKGEDVTAINYADLVHPDDLDSFIEIQNSPQNNVFYDRPFNITNRIKTVDQGYRWYEWSVNVLYENDQINRRISIGRDITEQLDQQERINYEITHDRLTGIYNANYLKNMLETIPDNEFTFCAFINIDNFRQINETYGHKTGDEFLIQFTNRIKQTFPKEFVKLFARISGDEFVIISNIKPDNPFEIHPDFQEHLEKINLMPLNCLGELIPFTISVGYADYPYSTNNPTEIFRFSEVAMFEAKKNRRNGVAKFDKTLYQKQLKNQQITKEVQAASFKDDFFMVFHPIFNNERPQEYLFEALLRWKHPQKGILKPHEFINVIENSGQLIEISRIMMEKICKQILAWEKITNHPIAISFNLSIASLRIKDEADFIINQLKQHNIPGEKLIIEITESLFYEENFAIKNNINQLKNYGIQIAIDDFGMNFSTLSMLNRVAYDIIKIDMYFTQNISNPTSNLLIRMIQQIADLNNKRCIVEGIESHPQFQQLVEIGISEFQGHYFNKPLTGQQISEKIKNNTLHTIAPIQKN